MPLINTVIKTVFRYQKPDYAIIEELNGDAYEFQLGEAHPFIEGEILHIRVEGLEKNLELGHHDRLSGVVVHSEVDLAALNVTGPVYEPAGTWKPEKLYGASAAEDLFPFHKGSSWQVMKLIPDTLPETSATLFNGAADRIKAGDVQAAVEAYGDVLRNHPGFVDCYKMLGLIAESMENIERALKYYKTGLAISEIQQPSPENGMVMPAKHYGNFVYLLFLAGTGKHLLNAGRNDEAVEYFRRCYQLNPWDDFGVRYALQDLTGVTYPLTEDRRVGAINPYMMMETYDIPILDTYDPDRRISPEKWLDWDEAYRMMLIARAHESFFRHHKLDLESIQMHIAVHDAVETFLAANEPPSLRLELTRCIAAGMSRHDAIHHLGEQYVKQAMRSQRGQEDGPSTA